MLYSRTSLIDLWLQERCLTSTRTRIVCPSPRLNIPEASSRRILKRSLASRIRRQSSGGLLNSAVLDFSVGLELDGVTRYNDYRSINVYIDPHIYPFDSVPYKYKSGSGVIEIKVREIHIIILYSPFSTWLRLEPATLRPVARGVWGTPPHDTKVSKLSIIVVQSVQNGPQFVTYFTSWNEI